MVIKFFLRISLFCVLILLLGCPPADCTFVSKEAVIPNLVKIEPLQNTYQVGDVITYSVAIPSQINDFGTSHESINIFDDIAVQKVLLGGSEIHKLENNSIEVLEGSTETINDILVAFLHYSSIDKMYQFKAKITLTQVGNYILNGVGKINVNFDNKNSYCLDYVIETNIVGVQENGSLEFVVQ